MGNYGLNRYNNVGYEKVKAYCKIKRFGTRIQNVVHDLLRFGDMNSR